MPNNDRPGPDIFTSPLARDLAGALLERFCRYVRIDTQSRRDRAGSPSTPGQLVLGRLLADELREVGLEDAGLDANGYVTATLPRNVDGPGPVVGLLAHLDTTPDTPSSGVEPIVHHGYRGGVIELPKNGTRLDPRDMPELAEKHGHDLVTASGETLLGADDKAGVAEVMTAVAYLAAHPEIPRPTLRVAFTPDEEIGEGATLFDIDRFGADFAYTLDGSERGELQDETFSALEAIVTVYGVDVHPGQATGKLVNALRLATRIVALLPQQLTPEATSDREGFIHVYAVTGTPSKTTFRAILRDFDDEALNRHRELLERLAHEVIDPEPRARVTGEVREQYRNMRRYLERVPNVLAAAEAAIRAEGIEPVRKPIRGGTDGSRLSEMGLPTPNLFTGGHEYHSVREWTSLQDMAAAAATIIQLAEAWTRPEYALAPDVRGRAAPAGARSAS